MYIEYGHDWCNEHVAEQGMAPFLQTDKYRHNV